MAGKTTSVPPNRNSHDLLPPEIPRLHKPRPENHFVIVANNCGKEKKELTNQDALIAFTEKLATDAKNGTLKGLAGIADYDAGYLSGLEGSYWDNPESAVLPLKMLDRNVVDKIIAKQKGEE